MLGTKGKGAVEKDKGGEERGRGRWRGWWKGEQRGGKGDENERDCKQDS